MPCNEATRHAISTNYERLDMSTETNWTEYAVTILFSTPAPLADWQLLDIVGAATAQVNEPEVDPDDVYNTPATFNVRANFGTVA